MAARNHVFATRWHTSGLNPPLARLWEGVWDLRLYSLVTAWQWPRAMVLILGSGVQQPGGGGGLFFLVPGALTYGPATPNIINVLETFVRAFSGPLTCLKCRFGHMICTSCIFRVVLTLVTAL